MEAQTGDAPPLILPEIAQTGDGGFTGELSKPFPTALPTHAQMIGDEAIQRDDSSATRGHEKHKEHLKVKQMFAVAVTGLPLLGIRHPCLYTV
jgi:hypothetical protein